MTPAGEGQHTDRKENDTAQNITRRHKQNTLNTQTCHKHVQHTGRRVVATQGPEALNPTQIPARTSRSLRTRYQRLYHMCDMYHMYEMTWHREDIRPSNLTSYQDERWGMVWYGL